MENINYLKINSLSKSSYIKGLQCPKALWFSNFRKDLKLPVDEKAQSLFDVGNEINDLARKYFPEGKKAADGYFVVPGDDLVLPTGSTIRKITIDDTMMLKLAMQPGGTLLYKDVALAKQFIPKNF